MNRTAEQFTNLPLWGVLVALAAGVFLAVAPLNGLLIAGGGLLLAGLGYLVLREPLVALLFTLVVAPFGALLARLGLEPGALPSGQLLLMAVLLIWGIGWLVDKKVYLPAFSLQLPLLFFLAAALLSLLGGESLSLGLKELLKWVEILLIIWLVLDRVLPGAMGAHTLKQRLLWLLPAAFLPPLVQAFIGLWQFTRPGGPESFQILGRFYRAFGTFEQPNPFGGFIALHAALAGGLLLGLAGLVLERGWRRLRGQTAPWPWRPAGALLLLLPASAILAVALLASWSRGAWLGFAAGAAAIVFFWPRRRSAGAALIAAGMLLALLLWQAGLVPEAVSGRLASAADFRVANLRDIELSEANYALLERLAFWEAAAGMARENLWFGVGFGSYDAAYADFSPEGWPRSLGHAHNYYLNLLAEVGLLGLVAYLVFWAAVIAQAVWLLNRLDGWPRATALGLIGVWVTFSIHHLVDKLYVNNFYLQVALLLAVQQLLVNLVGLQDFTGRSVRRAAG